MPTKKTNQDELTYNGRIISRAGNKIYYGNADDELYVEMKVNKSEMIGDLEVSTNVSVNLVQNNKDDGLKVIKSEKKEGLFSSIETASSWLEEGQQSIKQ